MDIRRKPVPAPTPMQYGVIQRPLTPNLTEPPPPLYSRKPSPSRTASSLHPPRAFPRHRSHPNLNSSYNAATSPLPPIPRADTSLPPSTTGITGTSNAQPATSKPSFYADTRHFLGGLIHHPSESTKHYSILRHSHGVVFYRGPSTSVDVSIFADTPLPADRSLWLQPKGWTGKTGMRAKALLHLHDDWIDVSPALAVRADQVETATERAWQRDIAKFRKRAPARIRDTHQLRETVVARIPPDAGDGYFQLVLCHGKNKKVLCRSPVFRLLSTSASPSSLRGASLASMPLEVGAMVLGMYAQTAAQTAAQTVLAPVTTAVNTTIEPYRPSWLQQTAASTAASTASSSTGLMDRFVSSNNNTSPQANGPSSIDQGPQPPFPIDFSTKSTHVLDATRLTIKVPPGVQDRLNGFFFGWARAQTSPPGPWQPTILSMRTWDPQTAPGPITLSQTARRCAALRFLPDGYDDAVLPHPLPGAYTVRILGFLRPDVTLAPARSEQDLIAAREAAAEAALLADECDAGYARGILEHPLWGAEGGQSAPGPGWMERTRTGLGNVRTRGQRVAERMGVRSGLSAEGGGYYIPR